MQTYDSFNALATANAAPLVSDMSVFNTAATETTNDRHSYSGRGNLPINEDTTRQDVHNKWGEFSDTLSDYGMYSDLDPKKFDEIVKEYIRMLQKKFRAV